MTAALLLLSLLPLAMNPLVSRLGHPSWRTREAAHKSLAALGRLAVPSLEAAAASHPSAETRSRCLCLLRPFCAELADRDSYAVLPTSWPRRPWLNLYDSPITHYLASARGLLTVPAGAPDWAEYREGTRLWVASQLLQRRPLAEIIATLDRLAAAERAWIEANGRNYRPPITLPKGYER